MPQSRADLIVNLTLASTFIAPLGTWVSTRLAVAGRYQSHRRLQISLLLWCWASVVAFEALIRFSGGSGVFVALAPADLRPLARWLLSVHVAGAVATYGLWTWLAWASSRRFMQVLPGRFSRLHRRLGWTVFAGLCFTLLSASGMYLLAFLL